MRGAKPKPTMLKVIAGNPGNRPLNQNEPIPTGNLLAAPDWMSPSQVDGWDYAIACAPAGLLRRLDRSLLAVWVVAEDMHREAAGKLQKYGTVIKSPKEGVPMQSPYLAILNKQAMIMMKAGAELGFSPSSRTRISAPGQAPAENRFSKFGRRT